MSNELQDGLRLARDVFVFEGSGGHGEFLLRLGRQGQLQGWFMEGFWDFEANTKWESIETFITFMSTKSDCSIENGEHKMQLKYEEARVLYAWKARIDGNQISVAYDRNVYDVMVQEMNEWVAGNGGG